MSIFFSSEPLKKTIICDVMCLNCILMRKSSIKYSLEGKQLKFNENRIILKSVILVENKKNLDKLERARKNANRQI